MQTSNLPKRCYSLLPDTDTLIILVRGEPGFTRSNIRFLTKADARQYVNQANQMYGITKAQEKAMLNGALYGWGANTVYN